MDDILREFLTETNESLDVADSQLVTFEQDPGNVEVLNGIFRLVHTIKGTCGFIGLPRPATLAHAAETLMDRFREGAPVTPEAVGLIVRTVDRIKEILAEIEANGGREPAGSDQDLIGRLEKMAAGQSQEQVAAAKPEPKRSRRASSKAKTTAQASRTWPEISDETAIAIDLNEPETNLPGAKTEEGASGGISSQSIRVNVDVLEHLMTMVSELVPTRNQLMEISRGQEESGFQLPLQRLSTVTAEVQEAVMRTRMQPIGSAWQKLPRIIRDLAQDLGKQIELEMVGADTELDRQVLDLIKDPLTHMVRNSADHGLETPEERRRAGKPDKGTVRLSAYHEGGHIIVEIADDGRGLNTDRIRAKALENRLASEAELAKMSDAQIHRFIFHAGFSTAETVTSVSGRGVGMDVVRSNIEIIGGTVDVRSRPGQGSTFLIKIPLTLAIVPALLVEAAGERFAIPQLAVVELVKIHAKSEHKVERIKDAPVLRLRDKLLPIVPLSSLLGGAAGALQDERLGDGFIAVMQVGSHRFGIVVDAVFHTEEIVVKPLSSLLRGIPMFSGSTILGDGRVVMIIDPNGIAQAVASLAEVPALDMAEEIAPKDAAGASVSLLLFRAGSASPKAVPLSLVTRLEEFDIAKVEQANGEPILLYRGSLIPLVYVSEASKGRQSGTQPMLVFSDGDRTMGLVVDEIVDIVEDEVDVQLPSEVPGFLGSAIIGERATEILDIAFFLSCAFKDWFDRRGPSRAGSQGQILFVDDNAFFRNLMTPVLKGLGYEVTACGSGAEALSRLAGSNRYDLIVTDIEMPEMDGFQLAEAIRMNAAVKTVPIIALSGLCTPEAVDRGRSAGFNEHVAKMDRDGLIATLNGYARDYGVAA